MTPPSQSHASGAIASRGEGDPIPDETADLVAFILDRYHAVHRRELAQLIELARKVEGVHSNHPEVPRGLTNFLGEVLDLLQQHMQKEEMVLFPMIRNGGHPMIAHPIAMMRAEHEEHTDHLTALTDLTGGFKLPEDACGSWRALYAGLAKFSNDLIEHIRIENEVLFPRFSA